jgi:hypothetical protein
MQDGKEKKEAQAALEFLTTYAWAFIVILITVGALYYFGVFDFSRFVPEKCVFSPQFACTDFTISQSGISLRMANTLGETVNITTAQITNDAAPPLTCTPPITPPNELAWPSGVTLDINFTSCSGGGLLAGERIEARVQLQYFAPASPTQTTHTIQGKVSGRVLAS